MHVNSGYEHEAGGLLERFARVFGDYDAVVSPSASCVAHVRERIPAVRDRVFELTEFLVDRLGRGRRRRVVPASGDAASDVPLAAAAADRRPAAAAAARRCAGSTWSSWTAQRECCGFGGTFAVKNADTSMAMLSDKVRHVLDTRAEVCTSADTSCLMHIGGALRAAADRACGRCTSPRSWRRRNELPDGAREVSLQDSQLRRNIGKATTLIRAKRERAVAELPDWEALRDAGEAIKAHTMATLPEQLERLEAAVTRAGGVVHWARDGAEANAIVARIARAHGTDEVIKVKSLATDEIGMNEALEAEGIHALETDLAELIVQLGAGRQAVAHPGAGDPPQPRGDPDAVRAHDRAGAVAGQRGVGDRRGRAAAPALEVPDRAGRGLGRELRDRRDRHDRRRRVRGQRAHVPDAAAVLVTLMGIEKVLPAWQDLEVFLQLLPRSSTAERMNPYTSLWTGVRDGRRAAGVPSDPARRRPHRRAGRRGRARQALHCIRCSACLNVCPVYERVGGQAYESVYPGPIGAILTPLLNGLDAAPSLPWASSLCGACYEVCPVKIDIPSILVHLRGRVVREEKSSLTPEALAMKGMAAAFGSRRRYEGAQRLARLGRGPLAKAAVPGWTAMRDLPEPPKETFRDWWQHREPRPAPPRDAAVGGDVT